MATLSTSYPTLLDLARRLDPDGKIQVIAEVLHQTNEVLDDMQWKEGNLTSGEKTTVRTGLPGATWRKLNYGVQPTKSATAQITDSCGMLEAYAEIDKSLADLNGNSADFRFSEDRAFLEAMNIEMAKTLFYGDTAVNPERFLGLSARYPASTGSASSANVLKGGGAGSTNTSVWMCVWGPQTGYGIYPKGSKAGFVHEDHGQRTLFDVNQNKYEGYRTHYKWDCGLTIRDWRYFVRIANIDTNLLVKDASSGADLVDLMVQAMELLPAQSMGQPVFYANKLVRSFLRRQIAKTAHARLTLDEVGGRKVLALDGCPVRRCDALLNTEATIA